MTKPGRGAKVAIVSMSWRTVRLLGYIAWFAESVAERPVQI